MNRQQSTILIPFNTPGRPEMTRIWVSGAIDLDDEVPAKMFIEERDDNKGYSLKDPTVMAAAMKQILDTINIEPDEVEWYALGANDEIFSLDVKDEMLMRPSPQWQALSNSGDLNRQALEKAKETFPDEEQRVISTQWNKLDFYESRDLSEAFNWNEKARDEVAPQEQPTPPIDLSKEYFPEVKQEPETELGLEGPDQEVTPETVVPDETPPEPDAQIEQPTAPIELSQESFSQIRQEREIELMLEEPYQEAGLDSSVSPEIE